MMTFARCPPPYGSPGKYRKKKPTARIVEHLHSTMSLAKPAIPTPLLLMAAMVLGGHAEHRFPTRYCGWARADTRPNVSHGRLVPRTVSLLRVWQSDVPRCP